MDQDDAGVFDKAPDQIQAEELNNAAMEILGHGDGSGTAAAISMLRRALAIDHKSPDIHSNLGLAFWRGGQIAEARSHFRQALVLRPDSGAFHGNYGVFLSALSHYGKAEDHLLKASELSPGNAGPIWDRALLYLREGDWEQGLALYDARKEHRGPKWFPNLKAPQWAGEDLSGKTLYVQAEQGVGDRFLFARYFAWIKDMWPTCTLKVCIYDSLVNVFWDYRKVVDEFLPVGIPWPDGIDYAIYLCSLPNVHGTRPNNIPSDPGYLRQRILTAREKTTCNIPLPHLPSLKVGLVWTGNPEQAKNHDRSIPLEQLLPLAEDPRVALYGFQCGPGQADIGRLQAHHLILDVADDIQQAGWVGTGLALMEMDLVITVCTSVAHFAGALGIPTWTLLCADPYWIWGRDGSTIDWYPNMRLFRQNTLSEWKHVLIQVQSALTQLADKTL